MSINIELQRCYLLLSLDLTIYISYYLDMKSRNIFRVKEEIVRGVALQVFILSLVAIFTSHIVPIIILLTDFIIRVLLHPSYSPLVWISGKVINPIVKYRKRIITFKPKRFAAGIGIFMSALALYFYIVDLSVLKNIVLSILALFSFLETFFKFCAGCKIFGLLIKLKILPEEVCEDCSFQGV